MKSILFFISIFILAVPGIVSSQNYAVGDGVLVAATSGLRLRVQPDLQSPTIKVLKYNDYLEVVQLTSSDKELSGRIQWQDGQWIRVKSGHVSGWVFDGFVTTLPLPDEETQLCIDCNSLTQPLNEYISAHFGVECAEEVADTVEDLMSSTYLHDGGIQVSTTSSDGWYRTEIIFENNRLSEVINLLRSFVVGSEARSDFDRSLTFHEDRDGLVNKVEVRLFRDDLNVVRTPDGYIEITAMVLTNQYDYQVMNE